MKYYIVTVLIILSYGIKAQDVPKLKLYIDCGQQGCDFDYINYRFGSKFSNYVNPVLPMAGIDHLKKYIL